MTTDKIIKKLRKLGVPDMLCSRLQIVCHGRPDLVICMVITRIIHEYNSTEENEAEATELMQQLIINEFTSSK